VEEQKTFVTYLGFVVMIAAAIARVFRPDLVSEDLFEKALLIALGVVGIGARRAFDKYLQVLVDAGRKAQQTISGKQLAVLLCLSLCVCGCDWGKAPDEVQDAAKMQAQALASYAKNNAAIIDAVIDHYRQAEVARAEERRLRDIEKFRRLGDTVKTQDAIDTMLGIRRRYETNIAETNEAVRGLQQAAAKAQTDLAIILKLQQVLNEYNQTGVDASVLQEAAARIVPLLQATLKKGKEP